MTTSILECNKCRFRFNYRFIPGASISAMRLGTSRYMRCPKCNRFGLFSLMRFGTDPKLRTYSDARITARSMPLIMAPLAAWLVVSIVWLRPLIKGPAVAVLIAAPTVAIAVGGALLLMLTARLQEVGNSAH